MDDILRLIYMQLVNSHRPQISTIAKVLSHYCKKRKVRGLKREVYVWNPQVKSPEQIKMIKSTQTSLELLPSLLPGHNAIIQNIAEACIALGFEVHIGNTEQKKSAALCALSAKLVGFEFGLSPRIFRQIKEIDLIIFKSSTILAAVEVATSIGTFNKAINDRFRNLLTIAPNLSIKLHAIVNNDDIERARVELFSPANVASSLAQNIVLHTTADIIDKNFIRKLLGINPD
jgi:hypothetical protein